jgi:hypothetical protein
MVADRMGGYNAAILGIDYRHQFATASEKEPAVFSVEVQARRRLAWRYRPTILYG